MMGKSFGGGGGGGRGMLKTFQRAVRAGVGGAAQEPFSHSTTGSSTNTTKANYKGSTNKLHLSSPTTASPFSSFDRSIQATSTGPSWPSCASPTHSEDYDWECVDGSEYQRSLGFFDDYVFGSVPTKEEAQHAVSALQQVIDSAFFSRIVQDKLPYNSDQVTSHSGSMLVSSVDSEPDWIEPAVQLCTPTMLQPAGCDRVYDAFHLLQTEPSVQRLAISLASDRAVWEAVLNNEVVRELRESLNAAEDGTLKSSDENSKGSNAATNVLMLIFDRTKAKVVELMEKIFGLVNAFFQTRDIDRENGEGTGHFEEKLKSSFLICIVVLLIVVVTRAHGA